MTRTILKNIDYQRREYDTERFSMQTDLMSLRSNIWEDGLVNTKIKSMIRTALYTYKQKYSVLSSLTCKYHLHRAISISKKNAIDSVDKERLCVSLDYLIARFNKKEDIKHE